jgi:hypothetical protein
MDSKMNKTCVFSSDGTLINIGEWDYQFETVDESGTLEAKNPLPAGAYTEVREVFTAPDGSLYLSKDPFTEGEAWVGKFFSTARLLQMKVWWDTFPHESTPKLLACYQWSTSITVLASQGAITFPEPPHTFAELVEEITPLIEIE